MRDDDNLEVETSGFPENREVALPALTKRLVEKMEIGYVFSHTSEHWVATRDLRSASLVPQLKIWRQTFNKPLEVYRRLTRIIMSYCDPLKYAMIVYYEAYELPEYGFIHGSKCFLNDFCILSANE